MTPIAYKLRSLSDLPRLILQVAGTPTQGVLVSDRIDAFLYHRFSSAEQTLMILAKTGLPNYRNPRNSLGKIKIHIVCARNPAYELFLFNWHVRIYC